MVLLNTEYFLLITKLDMKCTFFNPLTICLATSGWLAIAPTTFSQSLKPQITGDVQHLTCLKDAQGLICKIEERDSNSAKNPRDIKKAKATESLKDSTAKTVPQLLSSAQLEFISNILLGFLYFVLPAGLGLGIFLHDKYYAYRSHLLKAQIERLERLWQQNPQH